MENLPAEINRLKKQVEILKEEIQIIVDVIGFDNRDDNQRDRYEKLKEEYGKI